MTGSELSAKGSDKLILTKIISLNIVHAQPYLLKHVDTCGQPLSTVDAAQIRLFIHEDHIIQKHLQYKIETATILLIYVENKQKYEIFQTPKDCPLKIHKFAMNISRDLPQSQTRMESSIFSWPHG